MSITMQQLDAFIDTAINRFSCEGSSSTSQFYVDLRSFQQRITKKLEQECIELCRTRGIYAERQGDGLTLTVDLNACSLNPIQAGTYNTALAYVRTVHGNHL